MISTPGHRATAATTFMISSQCSGPGAARQPGEILLGVCFLLSPQRGIFYMGRGQALSHLDVSRQQDLHVPIGNQASGPKHLEGTFFVTWDKGYKSHQGRIQLQHTHWGMSYERCSSRGLDVPEVLVPFICSRDHRYRSMGKRRAFIFGVHFLFVSLLCC